MVIERHGGQSLGAAPTGSRVLSLCLKLGLLPGFLSALSDAAGVEAAASQKQTSRTRIPSKDTEIEAD
jgi:hypothetical protein